ncbi:hypothetical protein BBK36DRAFT_1139278 [Trichoderma citrinoviride]|uniref:Uncharacterized protein n=1 Tax=Trichoderma citrinoviride TaxID=58853 RepID=A0A2T4BIT4_9HYPO|nr:hypothetical protein BBK36DRAFT_1139278 [Trichoderma citrinoviride]PTB69198.1 hypothetical protein BBK36DRAFT_1139278 [Trichoderma citrinoviride]
MTHSVPCLALAGNARERLAAAWVLLELRAPVVVVGRGPEVPPGAVRWEGDKDWRWLMDKGLMTRSTCFSDDERLMLLAGMGRLEMGRKLEFEHPSIHHEKNGALWQPGHSDVARQGYDRWKRRPGDDHSFASCSFSSSLVWNIQTGICPHDLALPPPAMTGNHPIRQTCNKDRIGPLAASTFRPYIPMKQILDQPASIMYEVADSSSRNPFTSLTLRRRTTTTTHCNARSDGCDGGADYKSRKGRTECYEQVRFRFPLSDSARRYQWCPSHGIQKEGGPISEAWAVGLRDGSSAGVAPPRVNRFDATPM